MRAAEKTRIETIERVIGSVVAIYGQDRQGGGSGVIIDPSGLALTNAEARNSRAVMRDQNYRMISDDWNRMWYTDHPSRLSPFPVTYTSGNPR